MGSNHIKHLFKMYKTWAKWKPNLNTFNYISSQKMKQLIIGSSSNNKRRIQLSDKYDSKSYDELTNEIKIMQKDLFWMRIKRATRQEFKPSAIKEGKQEVARLNYFRRKQQMISSTSTKTMESRKVYTSKLMREYQVKQKEKFLLT